MGGLGKTLLPTLLILVSVQINTSIYAASKKAAKKPAYCPVVKKSGLGIVNISFYYAQLKKASDPSLGNLSLAGIPRDRSYFDQFSNKTGLPQTHLGTGIYPTKNSFKEELRKAVAKHDSIILNYTGHGTYFPTFKRNPDGTQTLFEWGMVLPIVGPNAASCFDAIAEYNTAVEKLGSARSLDSAISFNDKKWKEAEEYSKKCAEFVLTRSEIDEIVGKRPIVATIDACFAQGFCIPHAPDRAIAFSSPLNKTSSDFIHGKEFDLSTDRIWIESGVPKAYEGLAAEIDKLRAQYPYAKNLPSTDQDVLNSLIDPQNSAAFAALESEFSSLAGALKPLKDAITKLKNSHAEYSKKVDAEVEHPYYRMGRLTHFLQNQNLAKVDKNKNGQISVGEFFGQFPNDLEGQRAGFTHNECTVGLLNLELFSSRENFKDEFVEKNADESGAHRDATQKSTD